MTKPCTVFVVFICILIGACNTKNVTPFSVEDNTFRARDGFKVHIDPSFEFAGEGQDLFPVNRFGFKNLDKGTSFVFVTTSDGFTVKEIAAISYLADEPSDYFAFSDSKGNKKKFGDFDYTVRTGSGAWKNPFLKTHFGTCRNTGYSTTLSDHFFIKYTKAFRSKIRSLTYIIDYRELPEGIKTNHQEILQYLDNRLHEIFVLEK